MVLLVILFEQFGQCDGICNYFLSSGPSPVTATVTFVSSLSVYVLKTPFVGPELMVCCQFVKLY